MSDTGGRNWVDQAPQPTNSWREEEESKLTALVQAVKSFMAQPEISAIADVYPSHANAQRMFLGLEIDHLMHDTLTHPVNPAIDEALAERLGDGILDLCTLNPENHEVTTQSARSIYYGTLNSKNSAQHKNWLTLRSDLEAASASQPDGSELKTLVDAVLQAGNKVGLFTAAEAFFGREVSSPTP